WDPRQIEEGEAMDGLVIAVVALVAGVAVGAVIVLRTRGGPKEPLVLEGWLEAHAAELRRLGDSAASRDGQQERLRSEAQAARKAVELLQARDEERRIRDAEHAEVVKRLAGVLAGGSAKGRAG